MSRRVLYMTVGLPRSGKSTWSRHQHIPVVNPDAIRLAIHGKSFDLKHESLVWWMAHRMVESLFLAGHENVILDSTNGTLSRRAEWFSDQWERAFVVFAEPNLQLLKDRADMADMPYLKSVIDHMAATWEPISDREVACLIIDGYATKRIVL